MVCLSCQALGVPTGSHGAFRDYQVDAITMEISPKLSRNTRQINRVFVSWWQVHMLHYEYDIMLQVAFRLSPLYMLVSVFLYMTRKKFW